MKIHVLQHVAFEGLSSIDPYLKNKGHQISYTHLYDNEKLPNINQFDWIIIMGGPMGIYDEAIYPWLTAEKKWIKSAIHQNKIILGICLGAQLIADVLGAKVYKNQYKEIGWFNINPVEDIKKTLLDKTIPENSPVFHWHGDTFDIPENCVALAESEACKNQGFVFNNRVVALQFHLETTLKSATTLIENCKNELDSSQYVQTAEAMLKNKLQFSNINQIMFEILNKLESQFPSLS